MAQFSDPLNAESKMIYESCASFIVIVADLMSTKNIIEV